VKVQVSCIWLGVLGTRGERLILPKNRKDMGVSPTVKECPSLAWAAADCGSIEIVEQIHRVMFDACSTSP
jgi:hypothetical protein